MLKIDVREAVLDAADELLGRYGYRRMTMDDVAKSAGIGKGTIYLHFRSKEELALSTIDRLVDRVVAQLEEQAAAETPAADRLRKMLRARVMVRFDAVVDHLDSLDDLLSAIRPRLLEQRRHWFKREADVFARVLRDGADSGELAVDRPAEVARDLLAATNAFLPYSLTAREIGRRSQISAQVLRIADLLIGGLIEH